MDGVKPVQSIYQLIGGVVGTGVRFYLKGEVWTLGKLSSFGFPVLLVKSLLHLLRFSIIAAALYASYWVAFAVLTLLMTSRALLAHREDSTGDDRGYDSDALFPDPYAPENIHDPAFDHSDFD